MKSVIDFLNRMNDMDWGWWPLIRLRPPKHTDIDNLVVLKLTTFFGTVAGVVAVAALHGRLSLPHVVGYAVAGWLGFFVAYRITFVVAWNSRARALRQGRAKRRATRGP